MSYVYNRRNTNNHVNHNANKLSLYERNYQWVIRNISENLKRGAYRNILSLQNDLDKLQNNEYCQSYYSQISKDSENIQVLNKNKKQTLHIQEPWFTEIINGRKTVEGRTGNSNKFKYLIGSSIIVTNGTNSETMFVKDVRHYNNLDDYIENEGWNKIAPHTGSNKMTRKAYDSITMKNGIFVFSERRVAERGGICAIELSQIKIDKSTNSNKMKEDVFLPLNKILKYNNTNERREPQTLNHSKKQFSSISKTQSIQVKTDDDMIYNFKAYSHIDLNKTGEKDEFVFCFLFQLSNLYKLLSGRERREYRSQLYRKIVADYDSKDLYHKHGYSDRRMNRNGMKSAMMRQAPLDLLGQILLMDYFKINVLVFKPDKKQFLTYLQYNENYANILLKYQHNKFTPMEIILNSDEDDSEPFYSFKMLQSFVENNVIDLNPDNIVNPFTRQKLKSLSAYKLANLREIAEGLSIELNKLSGDKEKKKTKKELYDEIKALYEV